MVSSTAVCSHIVANLDGVSVHNAVVAESFVILQLLACKGESLHPSRNVNDVFDLVLHVGYPMTVPNVERETWLAADLDEDLDSLAIEEVFICLTTPATHQRIAILDVVVRQRATPDQLENCLVVCILHILKEMQIRAVQSARELGFYSVDRVRSPNIQSDVFPCEGLDVDVAKC